MPEAGRTPTPQVKRGSGPEALAWGEAAAANALMHLAPQPDTVADEFTYEPTGDAEEFIFSTDRPAEPITAGAPFGPGPAAPLGGFQTDEDVVKATAAQISLSPNASPETKAWAARARAGE